VNGHESEIVMQVNSCKSEIVMQVNGHESEIMMQVNSCKSEIMMGATITMHDHENIILREDLFGH
jgi:hypothetical protein